jgi:hypothetical protein
MTTIACTRPQVTLELSKGDALKLHELILDWLDRPASAPTINGTSDELIGVFDRLHDQLFEQLDAMGEL